MEIHQFGPNKDLQLCSGPPILFKWKNGFRSLFSFIQSKDCSGNATFQAVVWDFFLKSWQCYHTGNTVANAVHVLEDLEQGLRSQEGAALGQRSVCHCPGKHSCIWPEPTGLGKEVPGTHLLSLWLVWNQPQQFKFGDFMFLMGFYFFSHAQCCVTLNTAVCRSL